MSATPSPLDWGQEKYITPENRGEPPTGVLAAPWTAYHRILGIARKKAGDIMQQCGDIPRLQLLSARA